MSDKIVQQKTPAAKEPVTHKPLPAPKLPWETPKMEDVSEEVMAQPYIRFT